MKKMKINEGKIRLAVRRLLDIGGGVDSDDLHRHFHSSEEMDGLIQGIQRGCIDRDHQRIWLNPSFCLALIIEGVDE